MINVLVIGANGKMGSEVVSAVNQESDMNMVGTVDIGDSLIDMVGQKKPNVAVDFTTPDTVLENTLALLEAGVRPVVGTTGLSSANLKTIEELALSKNLGVAICPNFAIGAILMMKLAAQAAKHMPRAEIIEYHHDKKLDAPSGTALKTAEMMAAANPDINAEPLVETELIKGARGGSSLNIPIHSVRLPGYIAHQEVIFGGLGQTFRLRHDTISRTSFMPGVVLAIRKVQQVRGLVYGLEHFLDD